MGSGATNFENQGGGVNVPHRRLQGTRGRRDHANYSNHEKNHDYRDRNHALE